ncbi:hypothetical protein [Paenibacillus sp. FSL R7-0179]|uniref:hypothetical protein n=1 Tax=Paenibacillus sp. FSL R7-0179 TaxID=2921672 RepID=UPI0030F56C88
MNMNQTAQQSRNTRGGVSYVYVSYVTSNAGYIAVIDPTTDEIIKRITTGRNPTAMCLNPSGDKLYVADAYVPAVFVYSTETFNLIGEIPISGKNPAAIFVDPSGKKGYVINYGDSSVAIFHAITFKSLGTAYLYRTPLGFAGNENSPFLYLACNVLPPDPDSILVIATATDTDTDTNIDIDTNNSVANFDIGTDQVGINDTPPNPLTVHPNGHTVVRLGNSGYLYFVNPNSNFISKETSLLDNTVSGVYLDNGMLFCTMREERDFLKLFKNLDIDKNGNITYDDFKEIPSYKGQDKIRTSLTQKYIGVTIKPYDSPLGGLQIYDVDRGTSRFVSLASIGDLTFFSDSKAYVAGFNQVTPFDLATARPLTPIAIGTVRFRVKNVICGYSNQSS